MTRRFTVQRGATRVVFGVGSADAIGDELAAIGAQHVVVVSTPGRKDDASAIATRLGARATGVIAIAREHVPAAIVAEARAQLENRAHDVLLAVGGGSAIGLAKALALDGRARVAVVPTTYSGSEMTPVFGLTEGAQKKTGRDERVRPALVVYDPSRLATLPRDVALASLWNAAAHAVEALWAKGADRGTMITAEESLRMIFGAIPRIADQPGDVDACALGLEGAFLAGAVFGDVGGGLHHKLCHVLGGTFGLPHAATHAVVLPHVVRFHARHAPEAMAAIARAMGAIDPVAAIDALARTTTANGLSALGMPRDGIARVVDAMMASPAMHPRALDRESLTAMLEGAMERRAKNDAPPLRGPETIETMPGWNSTHESEAIAGALPRAQNTPQPAPLGLYPELLSGTPFTAHVAHNARVWMYRVRPSFSHAPFRPLPNARFAAPLLDVEPTRTRWKPLPIPVAPARVDFLDGLVTLGGAGDPTCGPGYAVHLYAANADMSDRAFSNADGDLLIVPQEGTLDVRTELGWLRAAPGSILFVPRALKFAVGVPSGAARGWMLEVFGTRLRLPERGPIGSNGLADARHFRAPVASFEDREVGGGFSIVNKLGGNLFEAEQAHSPFDVVAWHGTHAPCTYDLSLFNAMGSVTFDHADPSILTVLTAPLDDHGRSVADFVVFPPRWSVAEHSFRPPYMHRNAASEINGVVRNDSSDGGYAPGATFLSPLLTAHGISTAGYDRELDAKNAPPAVRLSDDSLWIMFESALPFRTTRWARDTELVDRHFLDAFAGMKKRFAPP